MSDTRSVFFKAGDPVPDDIEKVTNGTAKFLVDVEAAYGDDPKRRVTVWPIKTPADGLIMHIDAVNPEAAVIVDGAPTCLMFQSREDWDAGEPTRLAFRREHGIGEEVRLVSPENPPDTHGEMT